MTKMRKREAKMTGEERVGVLWRGGEGGEK